jgi:hypothetical protein
MLLLLLQSVFLQKLFANICTASRLQPSARL